MAKDRNPQQRRERFEKYYSQLDKDNSGHLNYEEFKTFLTQYNKKEMPEKQNEFYFKGADVDGGNTICKEELFNLVEALHNNDQLYINKLFFRAVDKDKSREIDAKEFVTMAELNGRTMSEEDAEAQIQKLTGGKSKMTFAQMHKALTGQDLPADTDPYEGQVPNVQSRSAPTVTLSAEEKSRLQSLIATYDKSGNGKLEFDEFYNFMKEGLQKDVNLKQMRFLYDGMDLDGSHNLDQSEILECAEKMKCNDFKWVTKMIFRGADKDNSRKVSIAELQDACDGLGDESFNQTKFDEKCKLEFGGKKKELEYWEFWKLISGETIPEDSADRDPYEGKLPEEKSKCCLLL